MEAEMILADLMSNQDGEIGRVAKIVLAEREQGVV